MSLRLDQKLQNRKIFGTFLFIDAHTPKDYDWAAKESSFDSRQRSDRIWNLLRVQPDEYQGLLSRG